MGWGSNGGVIGPDNDLFVQSSSKRTTFNSSGTFTAAPLSTTTNVSVLVVAGGGGSAYERSGGGGAGGYREPSTQPVPASPLPVTVGAGGAAKTSPSSPEIGNQGSDSVFATTSNPVTSEGGGYGAKGADGGDGGSGGGSSYPQDNNSGGAGNTPPVSPPQGFLGNCGDDLPGSNEICGGGGGAGAAGVFGYNDGNLVPVRGTGGTGRPSNASGSDVTYGGGGGGGGQVGAPAPGAFAGGSGGGGAGASAGAATAGSANTGGGGGGGGPQNSPGAGFPGPSSAAGGSGIVIVNEPKGTIVASGVWDINFLYDSKVNDNWIS